MLQFSIRYNKGLGLSMNYSYHILQKIVHWVMAFMIISMLVGGFFMDEAPNDLKPTIYMIHKSFGFLILLLIPIRLFLRYFYSVNPVHVVRNSFHKILIKASVPLLYLGMFLMAFSGFVFAIASGYGIKFFNIIDIPLLFDKSDMIRDFFVSVHVIVAPLMMVLIILHFLASLYHHFYLKDGTLKSMV
jgi:cytochrome b561